MWIRNISDAIKGLTANSLPDDFHPEVYLDLNPDVRMAKVDPVRHYLRHGIAEGRAYKVSLPTDFDPETYLRLNPDVAEAEVDPAKHYQRFGRQQGRKYRDPGRDDRARLKNLGFDVIREVKPDTAFVAERREKVFLKKKVAGEEGSYAYPELYGRWSSRRHKVLQLPRYHGAVDDFHMFEYVDGSQFSWAPVPGGRGYGGEGIPVSTVGPIIDLALDLVVLEVHSDFHWKNFIFVDDGIVVVDWEGGNFSRGTVESLLAYLYLLMFRNRKWQAELINQAKGRKVIDRDAFRERVDKWASRYIQQFRKYPAIAGEIRSMQRVFRSEKGFDSIWSGYDLFSLLDVTRYHVHDDLGQAREHATQIACRPKLAALHLERVPLKGRRVLDVGCSSGWFMNEFLKLGPIKVIGVDISERNCALARSFLKDVYGWTDFEVINEDILNLESGAFEVIASISMFHYIEDKSGFFQKIAGMLTPDGVFILETPVHGGKEDVVVWDQTPKRYVATIDFVKRLAAESGLRLDYFGQSNLEERRVFHFRKTDGVTVGIG